MSIILCSSIVRDEAFFLRAELGRLSATLRERSDHYDIVRARLIAIRDEVDGMISDIGDRQLFLDGFSDP